MSGRITKEDIISSEGLVLMHKSCDQLNDVRGIPPVYRIVEYEGKFTIQKSRIVIKETGILWWKKIDKKTVWDKVNEYGNNVYIGYFGMRAMVLGESIDPLPSLKEAREKIKMFIKGETIHYLK